MIEKIKELFNSMDREPVAILSRDTTKDVFYDDYDDDEPTYSWAVICKGGLEPEHYEIVMPFEDDNKIDILSFAEECCHNGVDALIKELENRDGSKLEWKK